MVEEKDFQQRIHRVEELVRKIETVADPETRATAVELMQSLMDLHGAGFERMMDLTFEAGEPGRAIIDSFARDQLIGSLLLLYGLHPLPLEERVLQALDNVRPYLRSHGGNVELLGVTTDGVVQLKLEGSCHGCASSALTLKLAIEGAVYDAAPDMVALQVEGVVEQQAPSNFVKLQGRNGASQPANGKGGWEEVNGLDSLVQGAARAIEVDGRSVLFCRLGDTFYAYESNCPGCGQALAGASFETTNLICPACEQRYDVAQAGRALNQSNPHLEPFPLLVEQGRAKVALPHR
jgi:Fe-S cluster biogenesis protein NfuA/nitrite reductase/ring-hydroxylating ferredoxin subunit